MEGRPRRPRGARRRLR